MSTTLLQEQRVAAHEQLTAAQQAPAAMQSIAHGVLPWRRRHSLSEPSKHCHASMRWPSKLKIEGNTDGTVAVQRQPSGSAACGVGTRNNCLLFFAFVFTVTVNRTPLYFQLLQY